LTPGNARNSPQRAAKTASRQTPTSAAERRRTPPNAAERRRHGGPRPSRTPGATTAETLTENLAQLARTRSDGQLEHRIAVLRGRLAGAGLSETETRILRSYCAEQMRRRQLGRPL
jgi:hypothetical protein